jgi:hypothetical protein
MDDEPIQLSRMTIVKTGNVLTRGYVVTGVVLMNPAGERCIIEQARVRWLSLAEFTAMLAGATDGR